MISFWQFLENIRPNAPKPGFRLTYPHDSLKKFFKPFTIEESLLKINNVIIDFLQDIIEMNEVKNVPTIVNMVNNIIKVLKSIKSSKDIEEKEGVFAEFIRDIDTELGHCCSTPFENYPLYFLLHSLAAFLRWYQNFQININNTNKNWFENGLYNLDLAISRLAKVTKIDIRKYVLIIRSILATVDYQGNPNNLLNYFLNKENINQQDLESILIILVDEMDQQILKYIHDEYEINTNGKNISEISADLMPFKRHFVSLLKRLYHAQEGL